MFLLPKGIPLAENISTSKIDLPAVLSKFRNSGFNGYAQVKFPSATGIFLYIDGRMNSALFQREDNSILYDLEAIKTTIESLILNVDGSFSAYRFSKEISFALLALFRGDFIFIAQEMKMIDFREVLEKIRAERMNACLKVYTDDRSGLIFYHDGAPIGFYHDTAQEVGLSQAEVQRIAGLPGAKIDLKSIKEGEEASPLIDLHDLIDIAKVWSVAKENVFSAVTGSSAINRITPMSVNILEAPSTKMIVELQSVLIEIAVTHLGKLGQALAEKEMAKISDPKKLLVPGNLEELLSALEKGSKMLTSSAKIRQMQDSMRSEIARYS